MPLYWTIDSKARLFTGVAEGNVTLNDAIDLLEAGRLDLGSVITDELPLDALERTMDPGNFPQAGKILVIPAD